MSWNILLLVLRPVIFLSLFLTFPQIKLAFGFGASLESGTVAPIKVGFQTFLEQLTETDLLSFFLNCYLFVCFLFTRGLLLQLLKLPF